MSAPRVGLLQACDDPTLLNFPLWPVQRELLASVERGPRLQVWCLGRRSGKTTLGALVALHSCLFRPDLDAKVRRGEMRHVLGIATRLDQAKLFVRAASSIANASPLIRSLIDAEVEDSITFKNGTRLLAFPATSRGSRGWPISTVLFDECAHMLDTEGDQAAEPLFRSLAPSTLQFGAAGRIVVSSTPYGESGFFAETFDRARSGELDDAVAHHFSSIEVNPTLDEAVLEQERRRDPEGYRGEILAQFVGSGGSYIDSTRLMECVADRDELNRGEASGWVVGFDAGFASDPSGVAVVGRDRAAPQRLRVGLVRAWAPQRSKSFEERRAVEDAVLGDLADIANHFQASVCVDQHMAPAVKDFLSRRGVSVFSLNLSAETKTLAFSELRERVNTGSIELYPSEVLLRELRGLRSRFAAGKSSVVTPRTSQGHSDTAVALALAVWRLDRSGIGGHTVMPQAGYTGGGPDVAKIFGPSPRRTPRWDDPAPNDVRRMKF